MIITITTRLQVVETELMPTVAASHVVAALVLVNSDCAFRAVYRPSFLLPVLKLNICFALAALTPFVRLKSAQEAHVSEAVVALNHILLLIWALSNVAFAGGLRAPPQVWIQVNYGISLEAHILFHKLLANNVAYFIFPKLLRASALHAANIHNFALVDLAFKVLFMAQLAKGVSTC